MVLITENDQIFGVTTLRLTKLIIFNRYFSALLLFISDLVKKGSAVAGVFGECRGPTHHRLVHAVAVVRHAHAPLVQVRLLLQQGAWENEKRRVDLSRANIQCHQTKLKKKSFSHMIDTDVFQL